MIHRKCPPRATDGFTLIELLVVISIIALLVGILLPVLGKSRQAARAMGCLSNERQLHVAISGYVQEYRRTYPQPSEDDKLSNTAAATAVWFNAVDRYLNLPAKNYSKGVKAERNEYVTKQDPAWSSDIPSEKRQVNRTLKMNENFGSPQNDAPARYTQESQVPQPSLTLMLVDGRARDVYPKDSDSTLSAFYVSEGMVGLRHSNGANVLFVDGHAKNVKQDIRTAGIAAPAWYDQDDDRQTLVWDFWTVRK